MFAHVFDQTGKWLVWLTKQLVGDVFFRADGLGQVRTNLSQTVCTKKYVPNDQTRRTSWMPASLRIWTSSSVAPVSVMSSATRSSGA